MPLWYEGRCDGMSDPGWNMACDQTARGAFNAKDAAGFALASGWRIRKGEWLCRACQERRKREAKARKAE